MMLSEETKKQMMMALLGFDQPKQDTKDGNGVKIAILQRGWVAVGDYSEQGDYCYLDNASIIRKWGTTKGLGEIAENGPTSSTVLDKCPQIKFHKLTAVAVMDCASDKWR